jgi:hypothetical protein
MKRNGNNGSMKFMGMKVSTLAIGAVAGVLGLWALKKFAPGLVSGIGLALPTRTWIDPHTGYGNPYAIPPVAQPPWRQYCTSGSRYIAVAPWKETCTTLPVYAPKPRYY